MHGKKPSLVELVYSQMASKTHTYLIVLERVALQGVISLKALLLPAGEVLQAIFQKQKHYRWTKKEPASARIEIKLEHIFSHVV